MSAGLATSALPRRAEVKADNFLWRYTVCDMSSVRAGKVHGTTAAGLGRARSRAGTALRAAARAGGRPRVGQYRGSAVADATKACRHLFASLLELDAAGGRSPWSLRPAWTWPETASASPDGRVGAASGGRPVLGSGARPLNPLLDLLGEAGADGRAAVGVGAGPAGVQVGLQGAGGQGDGVQVGLAGRLGHLDLRFGGAGAQL